MSEDVIRSVPEGEFPPDIVYPSPVLPDANASAPPHRLTVIERVYHQQQNQPPLQIESKFVQELSVDEACYFRPASRISEDWQALDYGFLKDACGTIVLQNISGRYLRAIPTPDAKKELDAKILEVGVMAPIPIPFALVPPKQNLRVNLMPGLTYLVRSQSGQAEFNLYAIPR